MLTFPANLSPTSYEDLEAYLQIFLRQAKRMAALSNVGPDADRLAEAYRSDNETLKMNRQPTKAAL